MFKLLIILIVVSSIQLFAQTNSDNKTQITGSSSEGEFEKVGSSGSQFLKIPVGGRGVGMGGAFTSVVDDVSALYWNPSGMVGIENVQVYIAHSTWYGEFTNNYAAVAVPINDDFKLGAFVQTFGANDIPVTTINRPEGTGAFYSVNDMSFGLSFAGALTQQFSFGITAKYVQNAFQTVSASAVAFDIGTQYDTGIEGIKLGFSIMNLSTETSFKGSALEKNSDDLTNDGVSTNSPIGTPNYGIILPAYPFSLPVIFRGGLSSAVIDNDMHRLIVSGDVITISDSPEQAALGFDYEWNEIISFRAGYHFNNSQMGFSGGMGLKYISGDFNGNFEYSASNTVSMGLIHRLNLILDF